MKKLLLAAFFIFGSFSMNAQFGIKAGLNFSNFRGDASKDFNVLTNWHIGGLYEVNITKHFSFQPELIYSVQGAKTVTKDEIKLNYFDIPLMLKLYPTDGFNIQVGPQLGMLLSESDNFAPYKSNTFDFGLAAGLEFFITDGFFIQARYYSGTKDVSQNRDLKNTMIQASIGVQF